MTQVCSADNVFPCQYPRCSNDGVYSVIVAERVVKYYCRLHAKQMVAAGGIVLHFPAKGEV